MANISGSLSGSQPPAWAISGFPPPRPTGQGRRLADQRSRFERTHQIRRDTHQQSQLALLFESQADHTMMQFVQQLLGEVAQGLAFLRPPWRRAVSSR